MPFEAARASQWIASACTSFALAGATRAASGVAGGLAVTRAVTVREGIGGANASALTAIVEAGRMCGVMTRFFIFAALLACAGSSVRAVFHPSDPSFRATPGALPRAYLENELDAVPRVPMRSVGLIEVTVPASSGMRRVVEAAAEKGRQLGCWILVEHSAFATLQSSAALPFGARAYLAHGGGGGGGHGPVAASGAQASDGAITGEFDCVMQAPPPRA